MTNLSPPQDVDPYDAYLARTFVPSILLPALAYADIVLLASDPRNLQKLIDKTTEWCCENDILINAEKTKIMHFRHKRRRQYLYPFYYNDQVLDYTVVSINTWVLDK